MKPYAFMGPGPRFYARWEELTFTAESGEIREFENPPTDGLWIPAPALKAKSAPKTDEKE